MNQLSKKALDLKNKRQIEALKKKYGNHWQDIYEAQMRVRADKIKISQIINNLSHDELVDYIYNLEKK